LLKVHLPELQKLKSFARVESNETLPRLGLSEYRLTDQFSRGTIVGSADLKVLHRPVELAAGIEKWRLVADHSYNEQLTGNQTCWELSIRISSKTKPDIKA
jgi:hypothetical protein